MKLIPKIIFAPIVVVLAVFVWLCALALRLSAWVLGIAGALLGILGFAILILDNVKNGIIVLVIALLVSPIGLPMLAAWALGQLQRLRYFIQDKVYA